MLQQTQVKTVIPYFERWMRELPNIEAVARVSTDRILKLWEGLGYYIRVRNLQKAAREIVQWHQGRFPSKFEDVLALPGIGPYTAGAICSIAFNQPAPILDGNVIRVLARMFGIRDNVKERSVNQELWKLAELLVCAAGKMDSNPFAMFSGSYSSGPCCNLNQALMELGAMVCSPRAPRCESCPLRKGCCACRLELTESLPKLGRRAAATKRNFLTFVLQHEHRVLVQKRPNGVVNANLWEFPNVEVIGNQPSASEAAQKLFGFADLAPKRLCSFQHTITRYRITLHAYRMELPSKPVAPPQMRWCTAHTLRKLAFPSAHRRIAHGVITLLSNGRIK